jgi:hypothetical protein
MNIRENNGTVKTNNEFDEKAELFKDCFQGRTDIVPRFFSFTPQGQTEKIEGYKPVCMLEFKPDCPRKKGTKISCKECSDQVLSPLSSELLQKHFAGQKLNSLLGIYPLLLDNTCHFIAADLDKHDVTDAARDPLSDAARFYEVCSVHELPVYIERSKSGNGYHAWTFFNDAVPAWKARTVYFALLQEAELMPDETEDIQQSSLDRLFPNQNEHREGTKGYGNLIALPLFGIDKGNVNSVFMTPDSGFTEPYQDQWAFLRAVERASESQIDEIIDEFGLEPLPEQNPGKKAEKAESKTDTRLDLDVILGGGIDKGERDESIFKYACRLREIGLNKEEAKFTIRGVYEAIPDKNDFTFEQALKCLDSAYSYETKQAVINQAIDRLNKRHAVVMVGGKCLVIKEITDPIFHRPDIEFIKFGDFKNFNANQLISNGKKKISVANAWIQSPKRRQYNGIVLSPDGTPDGYYNLWRGFAVQPKKGAWDIMEDHIFKVICNGNPEVFKWFMGWNARIVQNPGGDRPGTTVVLRSPEGTGKDTFAKHFGRIFGTHYIHITNQKHLTGNFNKHLKDAVFVFCDEGFWAGDKAGAGVLKSMITDEYLMIEPKGNDCFQIKNHVNLMMATNERWAVPAGPDARRFAVFDVSDSRKGDFKYFDALNKQMDNGGREAMLYDLLHLDISDTNLREIPVTDALLEQKLHNLRLVPKYWYDKVADGEHHDFWGNWLASESIYNEFKAFCVELKVKPAAIPIRDLFFKESKSILKKLKRKYKGGWGYIIPDLQECRDDFDKFFKMKLQWFFEDE